jgi:hypothetical protein
MAALAKVLADGAQGGSVGLFPPDAFRVGRTCARDDLHGHHPRVSDDQRAGHTIEELRGLIAALDDLGVPWLLGNPSDVAARGDLLVHRTGRRIGAAYRRHQGLVDVGPHTVTVNDIRLRVLCPDKLATHATLAAAAPHVRMPPTIALEDTPAARAWIGERVSGDGWMIVKPTHGTASRGVERSRAATLARGALVRSEASLVQDWVQPATTRRRGREHRFDVRVFVVGGRPVAGFARTASAPATGVAIDSPLAWLTTTGPLAPLTSDGESPGDEPDGAKLPADSLDELREISTAVVAALDNAARQLSSEDVRRSMKPYSELAGIAGPMELIGLCGRLES